MAFQPTTYEEAKAKFRPLTRSGIKRHPAAGQAKPETPRSASAAKRRMPKKKSRRRKKLTDGQLKKRAWKEFSVYIRTRGADEDGFNLCVTCPVRKHWKEMQAGHFIRGRLNSNLFDERGCHAQCYACNVGRDGNVVEYYEWMLANHGPDVIAELKQQNNQTHKWRPGELKELLEKYRALNQTNPLLA